MGFQSLAVASWWSPRSRSQQLHAKWIVSIHVYLTQVRNTLSQASAHQVLFRPTGALSYFFTEDIMSLLNQTFESLDDKVLQETKSEISIHKSTLYLSRRTSEKVVFFRLLSLSVSWSFVPFVADQFFGSFLNFAMPHWCPYSNLWRIGSENDLFLTIVKSQWIWKEELGKKLDIYFLRVFLIFRTHHWNVVLPCI